MKKTLALLSVPVAGALTTRLDGVAMARVHRLWRRRFLTSDGNVRWSEKLAVPNADRTDPSAPWHRCTTAL